MPKNFIQLFGSNKKIIPRGINESTLHHMCAIRARECWGLWNDGYPVSRIVEHFPSNDDYYFVFRSVDVDECFKVSDNNEEILNKFKRSRKSKNTAHLARFLVDLLRLEKKGILGRYDLSPNLVLIPNLSDIRSGTVEKTDVLEIAKLAAKIYSVTTQKSPLKSFSRYQSIENILSTLDGLEFRKDNVEEGKGKLIVNIDESPHRMWIKYNRCCYRLSANPYGYFVPGKFDDKNANGIEIPIQVTPYPDKIAVNLWVQRALYWQGNLRKSETARNFIGTMAAESHHAENSVYKYELVNQNIKKQIATVRIERRDGNGNAHDLWEAALSNREMDVALNSSREVFSWNDSDIWKLENIHEKNPYLLTIKSSRKNTKLSNSGYLKPASVPQRALMNRKEKMVKLGVRKGSIKDLIPGLENNQIYDFLNFFEIKERPKDAKGPMYDRYKQLDNWRISKKRNIMALQGPPGTGKTWTACQIVKDILKENPFARILVSSKEHLALDHLSNSIREVLDDSFDVVRINHSESNLERDVGLEVLPEAIAKKILKNISIPENEMREIGKLATWVEDLAIRTASVVCTTSLDSAMMKLQNSGESFDFAIIEEAGKSYPSELIGPMSISMYTLLIGDHLQLPPFELNEISKAIEDSIDEALKNWDKKEFRNSIGRELVELSTKYSAREEFEPTDISEQIQEWLQPFQLIHEITDGDVLSNQWRMFKSLSNSIGEIFYGQSFDIKKVNKFDDDKLPGIFGENKERLIMADIRNSIESNRNKSYHNKAEAKFVVKHLENLLNSGCDAMALTPYKGQVAEIRSYLPKKYHNHVRTVDGFQGKEADFILLSLVRSNKRTGSSRRWGFFRDPRRINVALSRAREGLVVVSSIDHIKNTDWRENEGQILDFLESVQDHGKIIGGIN